MKETKSRGESKPESPAEASLDEVLDAIETRLESLVEVVKGLSAENARLESERAAVRARIQRLLNTLEEPGVPGRQP